MLPAPEMRPTAPDCCIAGTYSSELGAALLFLSVIRVDAMSDPSAPIFLRRRVART